MKVKYCLLEILLITLFQSKEVIIIVSFFIPIFFIRFVDVEIMFIPNFRLLDILAGRKNKKYLIGDVLVNGKRQPNNFKLVSGYVVQVSAATTVDFVTIDTVSSGLILLFIQSVTHSVS